MTDPSKAQGQMLKSRRHQKKIQQTQHMKHSNRRPRFRTALSNCDKSLKTAKDMLIDA